METFHVKIDLPDKQAMAAAEAVWKSICKPLGSLGELERIVVKLAGIFGTEDVKIDKRCAVIACADNGVVAEGVSQSDSDVTIAVAREIAEGKSNINIMGRAAGVDTYGVDVGMKKQVDHPKLLSRRIAAGTGNIAKEPAMTRQQAVEAIHVGMEMVSRMKKQGYQLVITGEMGIGNTTTSSAIAAVMLKKEIREVTGRGAGLTSEGLQRKRQVIAQAIERNHPDASDPLDILAKLGGFDLAAMTGMFLGGGVEHIPVVIDGLISSVSALLAYRMNPVCREYMLASHITKEPAGIAIMQELGLEPVIHAGMRLGEGTGAVCLMPLLDVALAEYHHAHRFEETTVEQYVELQ